MAVEPAEDAIIMLREITGLPRLNTIKWLKANNNDANAAMCAWMDGGEAPLPPPQFSDTYSEDAFHTDRAGNAPQSQMEATFGPQPATLDPSVFSTNVPPTRPSSRVSHTRSGQAYGPENNPNAPREETYEEQLQRATEMSLNDSGILQKQETGVTYENPYFGPATEKHYESEKWAMTIPETNTQEIFLNPEAPDRRRKPGTPAFLKPSSSSNCLPALIKILHEIPMAREALLNRSHTIGDYGQESDWWDGSPIRKLRVVNVDESGQELPMDDIIYESQRLMAFLDETDRAYGSTDALLSLSGMNGHSHGSPNKYLDLVKTTTEASADDMSLSGIFTSKASQRAAGDLQTLNHQPFTCLSIRVDSETAGKGFTLYDAIDDLVWNPLGDSETFLAEVGDVLAFEVDNVTSHGGLGVSVPAVWYADRYLESSIPEAKQMHDRKAAITAQANDVDSLQALIMSYQSPGHSGALDAGTLVTKVTEFFRQTEEYEHTSRQEDTAGTEPLSSNMREVMEELFDLTKRVTERLKDFQDIRDNVIDRLKEVSTLYTEASDTPGQPPTHRYTLRGFSSHPHTIYVLEKDQPEEQCDMLSSSAQDYQWWKLEYITTSATPVQTTKVSEQEALSAASSDTRKALLLYASDRAVSYQSTQLPKQLYNFVRADNLAFQAELDTYNAQIATNDFDAASSPYKRKASSDSDLEVEYHRSPRTRPNDESISNESSPLDPNPIEIHDNDLIDDQHALPPPKMRPLAPKLPAASGSDPSKEASSQQRVEMQESGAGGMLLSGVGEKYKLGSYVPEMTMEDDEGYVESDEDQRQRQKG